MTRGRRRGGRKQQALTRLVLATYGRVCWLQLPGCTKIATTKDHITPWIQGGTDDIANFRPACKSCNSKRQDRNVGSLIRVVTGPPGAGKSQYVTQHAHPVDIVIDLDRIAEALVSQQQAPALVSRGAPTLQGVPPSTGAGVPWSKQGYPPHVRHVAIGARQAAIQRATRLKERVGVWIIHSVPKPDQLEEYKQLGWQVITVDPGEDVVRRRISSERTAEMQKVADKWYENEQAREIEHESTHATRDWGI